jgi:membrane-associated protein
VGAILWVSSVTLVGYFLGNVAWVEENLEKIILGIVFVSVLPMFYKMVSVYLNRNKK